MRGLARGLAFGALLAGSLVLLAASGVGSVAAWQVGALRALVPLSLCLALGAWGLWLAGRASSLRDPARVRAAGSVAGLVVVTALVCFAILEVGLRLLSPATTYERAKRRSPPIFAPSEIVPFVIRPGYRGPTVSRETGETVVLSVNSMGYRGAEFSLRKPPGTFRVLVLGDSFAANVAIPDDQLYTAVLERELNADAEVRCRVEIINAGWVGGSSPDAYVAYMLQKGFSLEPDLVLMQYFVLNDFKDLIENEVVEWQGDMPLRVRSKARYVDAEGRLRRRFDLKYRIPVLRDSHLLIHLWSLFDLEPVSLEVASWWARDFAVDNFYLGADGIRPEDVYLPPSEQPDVLRRAFEASLDYTRMIHREARRRGVEFVLFLVPTGAQSSRESWEAVFSAPAPEGWEHPHPQRAIAEALAGEGIPVLDPLRDYRREAERRRLYLGEDRDGHWTSEGNEVTAGFLRAFLTRSFAPFRTRCTTHDS